MGSNWSKLKRAIEKGEESRALELYTKNSDIRRKLNANSVINDQTLDTYMHASARHGMHEFLKLLLYENGGNPNKLNRRKQTVLHKVCEGSSDTVQYECMQLLLQWRDPNAPNTPNAAASKSPNHSTTPHQQQQQQQQQTARSNNLPHTHANTNSSSTSNNTHNIYTPPNLAHNSLLVDINVNAKDDADNTPLHYAAMKNLATCVQTLVAHGAYLFVENADHSTPCDLAEKQGHKDIALYLESKMIFSKDDDEKENNEDDQEVAVYEEKPTYGLRTQDLQEEKDKLLVETADMLRCSMFTAEILLKKHAWSKQNLLNAWIEDPIKCCEKCGISTDTLNLAGQNDSAPKSPSSPNGGGISNGVNASSSSSSTAKIRPLELDSNSVIARKLSGRYMNKKKESTNSLIASSSKTNGEAGSKNSNSRDRSPATSENRSEAAAQNEENKPNGSPSEVEEDPNCCCICMINRCESDQDAKFFRNNCGHRFCRDCWDGYLTTKIDEGAVNDIVCPQVDCFAIIPPQVVESLISKETAQRYLHFDLKAFVESNPTIKWCPYPGCGMAVKNPKTLNPTQTAVLEPASASDYLMDGIIMPSSSSSSTAHAPNLSSPSSPTTLVSSSSVMTGSGVGGVGGSTRMSSSGGAQPADYSLSVDCGNGHYFCWECLQEGHEPASCASWRAWFQKIAEIKPEELCQTMSARNEESSANYLWLVSHSKRCPNSNCQAPIQKNEGCNHVKCYRCKHDFCWICLEPWKKHSSATGGYFQCNRYEASSKILQKEKVTVAEAEELHTKAVELNKFVHYYTRFKNHEHSYKIEEPLLAMAKQKFEILTAAQQNPAASAGLTQQVSSSSLLNESSPTVSVSQRRSSSTSIPAVISTPPPQPSKIASIKQRIEKNATEPLIRLDSKRLSQSLEKNSASKEWSPTNHPLSNNTFTPTTSNSTNGATTTTTATTATAAVNAEIKSSSTEHLVANMEIGSEKSSEAAVTAATNSNTGETATATASETKTDTNSQPQQQPVPAPHQFIEDAIRELLKARRILRCSYVYGYYLETTYGPHKKFIFEFVQTEFEECTENLSQCIARPHLKTPKSRIIRLTNQLRRKRIEFIDTITRGLNTFNDTPPTLKKYSRQRWKYLLKDNIQNDDEFKNTIALSLKELNPKNPWIIDKKGRHTNLLALLDDWPELERDLESILVASKEMNGLCARWDCGNVRAVNTLSGSLCNYCSIRCMRLDHNNYLEGKKNGGSGGSSGTPTNAGPTAASSSASLTSQSKRAHTANNKVSSNSSSKQLSPVELLRIKKLKDLNDLDIDEDSPEPASDSEMARAIELSKFQQILDSSRKKDKNYQTFEQDMKAAIELSLIDDKSKETTSNNKADEKTSSATSKTLAAEPRDVLASSKPNIHPHTIEKLAVAPYEPFYLNSSNEKDVGFVLKNLKSIVYNQTSPEKLCQNKVLKVCNFDLNKKSAPV